jgi:hypothetical protein
MQQVHGKEMKSVSLNCVRRNVAEVVSRFFVNAYYGRQLFYDTVSTGDVT